MNCPQAEPTPCSSQLDCPQNSGGPQMFTCLPSSQGNECTFEGEYSATCAVLQPMVQVNAQLNPTLAAGSQSLVLRVFYPQAVDGSAITCGSLAQDPMVGADSNLNAMVVQGINIPAQAQTVIGFPTTLLPLEGAVFYMEAWSGPLDLNTEMPTGTQLAVGCLDNQTIQSRAISIQQMSVMIGGN